MSALPVIDASIRPDLTEARRLLQAGLKLVDLHPYQKRPIGNDWNKRSVTAIDPDATGYGLPLVPNKLCSFDPDEVDMARAGLKAWGFDLENVMAQGVRTASTRPGSGGRSAFAADEMEMLRWLTFAVFDEDGKSITVLELRAKSENLQDVVPGIVYADKTGQLCTQTYANASRFDDAPDLPDDFARFWRRLSTDDDALREHTKTFVDAIIAEGFEINGKRPQYRPPMGSGESLAFPAPGTRGPFNEAHTVPDIIERHGYPYDKRAKRYSHPGATGAPGIRPVPGRDGLWRSDHAGDALHGTFDAWAAHVQLDHAGDLEAAIAAAEKDVPPPPENPEAWPPLVDPFTEYPVPPFPLDILPDALRIYCEERAAQSGFDVGGYAFCILIMAGNTADHRTKLQLGPFRVPAYQNGGVVAPSGGGKSPVINAGAQFAEAINDEAVRQSKKDMASWHRACKKAQKEKYDPPPRPAWKQRHALDTTTEALAGLLGDNPEGVNMIHHEITEFLGRMDAYSKDGGKDRGVFLRAYDGGQVTVNRAKPEQMPVVVENFSVGILAGIQPEVLAQKFKQAGAGADGLYQRFSMYCLQPAGEVSYTTRLDQFTEVNAQAIFKTLHQWTQDKPFSVNLAPDAQRAMQDYHNHVRRLAQRTSANRFAEHLDKFPGMLGRFAFALHLSHAAATGGDPLRMVSLDTLESAKRLMACLYRHSEAVYRVLDREAGKVRELVQSAAEAILTKQWDRFKRGDLTRNATHWQGADSRDAESAIDYMIELGWLADITPATTPGKRGRRSAGAFLVNPDVHIQFEAHAERIREQRAERYEALRSVAGN